MKYYAIKDENHKILVDNWDEAKEIIKECNNPSYKSFSIKEEADAFLNDLEYSDNIDEPKAYIDGSYNEKLDIYGFGVILIIDGNIYRYKKNFNDEYKDTRNVAGEIKAAAYIINHSYKNGIKKLHIFFDYQGIESWYIGAWKANSKLAQKYQEFAKEMEGKIEVIFHKVKSHTNNKYNDLADKLAKEAVNL